MNDRSELQKHEDIKIIERIFNAEHRSLDLCVQDESTFLKVENGFDRVDFCHYDNGDFKVPIRFYTVHLRKLNELVASYSFAQVHENGKPLVLGDDVAIRLYDKYARPIAEPSKFATVINLVKDYFSRN